MDVQTAIAERRSIRKYKQDPVSDKLVQEVLEAARLAPSGTNHQPWRFVVIEDEAVKEQIGAAAFNQKHISEAPVLLVCCADLMTYSRDTRKRLQELVDAGVYGPEVFDGYPDLDKPKDMDGLKVMIPHAMLNVAIAMERYQESGDPKDKPSPLIVEKYVKGEWGKKKGKGFYSY